jgi:hypothetical protein
MRGAGGDVVSIMGVLLSKHSTRCDGVMVTGASIG